MRLQVEVWRENEDQLRLRAQQTGHRNLRDAASLVLNLKLQEDAQKLADTEQQVEEVA